jgi:hypothetical protein
MPRPAGDCRPARRESTSGWRDALEHVDVEEIPWTPEGAPGREVEGAIVRRTVSEHPGHADGCLTH